MRSIRQGDVYVAQVQGRAKAGKEITDNGRVILAYGEQTGHAHEVIEATNNSARQSASAALYQANETETIPPAQLFEEPDGTRYLFVDRPCLLVHQEHGAIALTPGTYRVVRQREYVAADLNRSVAD